MAAGLAARECPDGKSQRAMRGPGLLWELWARQRNPNSWANARDVHCHAH